MQGQGATVTTFGVRDVALHEVASRQVAPQLNNSWVYGAKSIRKYPYCFFEERFRLEVVFASFDLTPLAAASIGQAHAATLLDGTEVVVKVRRPDVDAQVEEDLEILLNLALVASRRWVLADQYDVVGLTQEFAETLRAELDYVRELKAKRKSR